MRAAVLLAWASANGIGRALAEQALLLEALQAGIAWQLARLGDPSLTGTAIFYRSSRQEALA